MSNPTRYAYGVGVALALSYLLASCGDHAGRQPAGAGGGGAEGAGGANGSGAADPGHYGVFAKTASAMW